ncbi:hypothetical protein [Microbacterium candidum]|uniref:Uncharacterized protein n=1 Tax=Microbacterium candidum TaxID=3041922 RepID=A0ABT7MTS6_9MICO|nr:hypothetical protein [Microbacterium sp. ASV49]MDL9977838.1 hypothetical protein [Microbacterium sp. ASV49]
MGWLRDLFRRGGDEAPYIPPEGRLTEDPIQPLPNPYGPGRSNPTTPGLGGYAAGPHIAPGYHEPDRPQDR